MHLKSKHTSYLCARSRAMSKIKSISKSTFTAVNESLYSTDYVAPTYISTFLNNVNGYAHSTRKETVGDLATIIFPEYLAQASNPSPADWKDYYLHNYQEKYDAAIIKLLSKFEEVKRAVNYVTEQEIKAWLEDFMFYKTFNGLYVQDAILADIAKEKECQYTRSTSEEEGRGIDGYIDGIAYSIKSETYKDSIKQNIESINATMVYYRYKYENSSKTKIEKVEYYIEEDEK